MVGVKVDTRHKQFVEIPFGCLKLDDGQLGLIAWTASGIFQDLDSFLWPVSAAQIAKGVGFAQPLNLKLQTLDASGQFQDQSLPTDDEIT